MTRTVYTYLTSQYENLGDFVLRRALVQEVLSTCPTCVYVGGAPASYVRGLGLGESADVRTGLRDWLTSASVGMARPARAAGSGGAAFVSNPGEISSTRHEAALGTIGLGLAGIGRAVGNPSLRVGVGARDRTRPWSLPHEAETRVFRSNVWRDQVSCDLYGGGRAAPDLAFALGSGGDAGSRRRIALSFRGDKDLLTAGDLGAIGLWCEENGLEPVVVTQVARDHAANAAVAEAVGGTHLDVLEEAGGDLRAAEDLVRTVLGGCAIVISNRIHGLIVGATEGAMPAFIGRGADIKAGRTMRAAGFEDISLVTTDGESTIPPFLTGILHRAPTAAATAAAAREDVLGVLRHAREVVA